MARFLTIPALCLSLFLFAYQFRALFVPILGEHDWRQADTYSVAYNFVHESGNFFHPRIDWTKGRSGIMGMETPIYPFLISILMRIFGDSPASGRFLTWLFATSAIVFAACVLRPPHRRGIGVGFLLMMTLSPAALFEFRQVQPDPVMTAMCLSAACFFHLFSTSGKRWLFAAGMAFYSAAVLTKSPALFLGPAMWLFSFTGKKVRRVSIAKRGALFIIPIALTLAWYVWAKHLNTVYNGGEVYFRIDFGGWESVKNDATNLPQLNHIFGHLLCIWAMNWTLYPAILAGAVLALEKEHRALTWPMLAWLVGASIFLALFSERLRHHFYYALPLLPPLAYAGALALGRVFELVDSEQVGRSFLSRAAVTFVLLALAFTLYVAGPARELVAVPFARDFVRNATWVSMRGTIVLTGAALAALVLALVREFRGRRIVYGICAVAAFLLALPRGLHDEIHAFRYRARTADWETFDRDWGPLRQAVAAHSTRNDVFIVDGGQPWYLYLPLRKGFAEELSEIDKLGIEYYTTRGARFYVHYPEKGRAPVATNSMRQLATGPRWELYSIH